MNNHKSNSKIYVQTEITSNHLYQTILASDIPLTYSESDLYTIFSHYGSVNNVRKLSNLSCCLIEFSDPIIAKSLIQKSKSSAFHIDKHKITLQSSVEKIALIGNVNEVTDNSTNIINLTISNVKYPITVDIIKQICLRFGKLMRIFIGKKTLDNTIECLIEFEKISEAKAAKEALNGEDIYSGCCSLTAKYSTISNVPVFKNDEETWDFTKCSVKTPILQSPTITNERKILPISSSLVSSSPNNVNNNNTNLNLYPVYSLYNYPPPMFSQISNPFQCRQPVPPLFNYPNSKKSKLKLDVNKDAFVVEVGVVFLVYNLTFNICVDHLFNIFCLYGNVNKVKFLINQPGCAMVQMGSKDSAETCIRYYNNRNFFGQEMRLKNCPKREIFDMKNVEYLPNGTPFFRDFSNDSNNRFLNDHAISNNKILEPNRTLHFFNAPYTFTEMDLGNMIIQSGVPRPVNIIIFNTKNDQVKKCIGLFEFQRLEDALIALSVLNHKPIIIPDTSQVFHMKLTFSAREPNAVVNEIQKRIWSCPDDNLEFSSKRWKYDEKDNEIKKDEDKKDLPDDCTCESAS